MVSFLKGIWLARDDPAEPPPSVFAEWNEYSTGDIESDVLHELLASLFPELCDSGFVSPRHLPECAAPCPSTALLVEEAVQKAQGSVGLHRHWFPIPVSSLSLAQSLRCTCDCVVPQHLGSKHGEA